MIAKTVTVSCTWKMAVAPSVVSIELLILGGGFTMEPLMWTLLKPGNSVWIKIGVLIASVLATF